LSDQQKADFQPVDSAESIRLLQEGAKTLASVIIWTKVQKDQEDQINTHLSMVSTLEKTFLCWLPDGFDAASFEKKVIRPYRLECFFSVSLLSSNIFFKANLAGHDPKSLKFNFPDKVFKVQRRQNLRFPVPDGHIIKVNFADPANPGDMNTRKLFDLSASGLAFIIPENEIGPYNKGTLLREMTFTIQSKIIAVEAEIRHLSRQSAQARLPGIKVGVQFKKIRAADSQLLATFVFDESRRYFSKFF